MRLPRRVPWSSIDELDQLCSWIYSDSTDEQKQLAINRISAWKLITPIPHALESTLSFLVVEQQDYDFKLINRPSRSSYLSLRQNYAAAIIRLVNGLVDPLQQGAYAKSIAAIAAQIGLPAWLVELRHAATHEDLPSLELLRQAARESMAWLLHNYFLPTLAPASAPPSQPKPLPLLAPLLKRYKTLSKIVARDVTLTARYKGEFSTVFRDIERWIGGAKIAANVTVGALDWGRDSAVGPDAEQDPREKWALERVCDALLEKGCLVPLSKKKRTFPVDSFFPPQFSVILWKPLLQHLDANHPDLSAEFVMRAVSVLSASAPSSGEGGIAAEIPMDHSYDMSLARWAFWFADGQLGSGSNYDNNEADSNLRDDLTMQLLNVLGPGTRDTLKNVKALTALLQALCDRDPGLEAARALVAQPVNADLSSSIGWCGDALAVMGQRLDALLAFNTAASQEPRVLQHIASPDEALEAEPKKTVALGWRLLDATSGWQPTPVGVYYSTAANT